MVFSLFTCCYATSHIFSLHMLFALTSKSHNYQCKHHTIIACQWYDSNGIATAVLQLWGWPNIRAETLEDM